MIEPPQTLRIQTANGSRVTVAGNQPLERKARNPQPMSPSNRIENQLLICVARRSLNIATAARLRQLLARDLDWEYLLATAQRHCLIPLLYHHLHSSGAQAAPRHVMSRLRDEDHENTKASLFLAGELLKLLDLLEAQGIQAIPFKGPTLALWAYGDVGFRQFGDLDILIHKRDVRRIKELLIGRGFKPTPELTKAQEAALLRFDSAYNFDNEQGVVLDVHWDFVPRYFSVELDTNQLWDRLELITLGRKQLPTLSPEDLLLVLCLHGFTHFWERLGWICDLASLIESRKDLNWQLVLENATTLGARGILSLGLLLAGDLLDASIPPEVLKSLQPDARVKKLAEQVRDQLFTERSAPAGVFAEAGTLVSLRERRLDRLISCLRLATTPRSYDWMFLSVPDSLFFLYYLVRPLRLAGKYGAKLLGDSGKHQAGTNGNADPLS